MANYLGTNQADYFGGTPYDDFYDALGGDDQILGSLGADLIDGGTGFDRVDYFNSNAAITIDLRLGTGLGGYAQGDILISTEIIFGSTYNDLIIGNALDNTLRGGDGVDTLRGGEGQDALYGDAGDDILEGGDANDRLFGGVGADVLDGGTDWDQAVYTKSATGVIANLADGIGYAGDALGDTYVSIEHLVGSKYDDTLIGDHNTNRFNGHDGDDIIRGGGGNDVLRGDGGNDILEGDDGNDRLFGGAGADTLDGGSGWDTVMYGDSNTGVVANLGGGAGIGGNASGDTYISIEQVTGSDFDDVLIGSTSNNKLIGGEGDDTLIGTGGTNTLIGGAGADKFFGGSGFDRVSYASADARITLNLDNMSGSGDAAGDSFVSIDGFQGTDYNDTLEMDDNDNWVSGGKGNDFVFAKGGDDILQGAAGADYLDGGEGFDIVKYSNSSAAVNIGKGSIPSGGDAEGDDLRSIEGAVGSDFDDIIRWFSYADGGGGDDMIRGTDGDDHLLGGDGDDYIYGSRSNFGAGADGADYMNGGDGNDTMYGGSDDDEMYGGDGNDTMDGGTGDDYISGGDGDDVVSGRKGNNELHGGAGNDTITFDGLTYYILQVDLELGTAHIEYNYDPSDFYDDTISGFENVVGQWVNDTLKGDDKANILTGAAGSDILVGRGGIDILYGGTSSSTDVPNHSNQFTYESLEDSPGVEDTTGTLTTYATSEADEVMDFRTGSDVFAFEADEFDGSVYNTDQISDLGLASASDSAFAYTDNELFYVHYASESDFLSDIATVNHIATVHDIASLSDSDFIFV